MARRTFIRLQLRQSSCDRIQSSLVVFSSSYLSNKKKFESISNGFRDIAKSLKISFGFIFVSLCAFGSKISEFWFPLYTFQTKKPHSIIITSSQVLVYTNFADEKVFFFLTNQEYIYMGIPISIIHYYYFHTLLPKFGNGYKKECVSVCLFVLNGFKNHTSNHSGILGNY